LNTLIHKRQELNQASQRLIIWYEDKQRLLLPDQMIPLKINEIERIQKKLNVRQTGNVFSHKSFYLGYIK